MFSYARAVVPSSILVEVACGRRCERGVVSISVCGGLRRRAGGVRCVFVRGAGCRVAMRHAVRVCPWGGVPCVSDSCCSRAEVCKIS